MACLKAELVLRGGTRTPWVSPHALKHACLPFHHPSGRTLGNLPDMSRKQAQKLVYLCLSLLADTEVRPHENEPAEPDGERGAFSSSSSIPGTTGTAVPAGTAGSWRHVYPPPHRITGGWQMRRPRRVAVLCPPFTAGSPRPHAPSPHAARAPRMQGTCTGILPVGRPGRDAHATGRHAPLQALAATTPRQRTARLCRATTGSTGSPGSTGRTEPPCAHRVGERSEVSVRAWVPQEPLAVIRDLCVPCALAAASSARARSRGRKRGQVRAQNRLRT